MPGTEISAGPTRLPRVYGTRRRSLPRFRTGTLVSVPGIAHWKSISVVDRDSDLAVTDKTAST
eukprot:1747692-Rhodomonas_salina.1